MGRKNLCPPQIFGKQLGSGIQSAKYFFGEFAPRSGEREALHAHAMSNTANEVLRAAATLRDAVNGLRFNAPVSFVYNPLDYAWAAHEQFVKKLQNAFIESFNGKLRDELLNEIVFTSLNHARELLKAWQYDYNHNRPHSGLGWLTPSEFANHQRSEQAMALGAAYLEGSTPMAIAPTALTGNIEEKTPLKTGT